MIRHTILPAAFCLAVLLSISAVRITRSHDTLTAYVSAEKQNVVYLGVDNPLSVSVPGIDPSLLLVDAVGGTVTGASGHYVVRVSEGAEVIVSVAYTKRGKRVEVSNHKFRVKRVPNPVCFVGNIKDIGMMPKANLEVERGIFARMMNFDFDMRFEVASFEMTTFSGEHYVTEKATGPVFTLAMQGMLKNAKPGDRVFIENVMVKTGWGEERKIPGVTIIVG